MSRICEALYELIRLPLADTLNLSNGMNYSQFLEALLRIAYMKLDESEQASSENGFKNILEQIF